MQDHVDQTLFLPLGESQWQELAPLNEVWNKHFKYNFKFCKLFYFFITQVRMGHKMTHVNGNPVWLLKKSFKKLLRCAKAKHTFVYKERQSISS